VEIHFSFRNIRTGRILYSIELEVLEQFAEPPRLRAQVS
jgi:hypothetical protein